MPRVLSCILADTDVFLCVPLDNWNSAEPLAWCWSHQKSPRLQRSNTVHSPANVWYVISLIGLTYRNKTRSGGISGSKHFSSIWREVGFAYAVDVTGSLSVVLRLGDVFEKLKSSMILISLSLENKAWEFASHCLGAAFHIRWTPPF